MISFKKCFRTVPLQQIPLVFLTLTPICCMLMNLLKLLTLKEKWIQLGYLSLRSAASGPCRRDSTEDLHAGLILYDI